MRYKFILSILLAVTSVVSILAQKVQPLVVKTNQPVADIQSTMWGIFFEDINFAADGGIYAELVKNRSFEFNVPLMGWRELKKDGTSGKLLIINRSESNASNPRYARITVDGNSGSYGLANEGFRKGMGIKKDMIYHFSIMARQGDSSHMTLRIELINSKGSVIGNANLNPQHASWRKDTVSFSAKETDPHARLNIWFEGKGNLDLDMVSLFPHDTWKNRPNGLRSDLVQMLADLKPGFLRFPGGCIVEGRELATRYQWKKSVGNVEDRQMIINRWNTEFSHRLTPDYFQTFGLGFYEYFQLAEDIGAEPLPIMNCGMACQFNTAEVVPVNQLDPYIQDMLDLIEFANGTPDTKWGKLRSEMGHPAPFHLKFIGVGNEQWGPQYIERYKDFVEAIHSKYSDITIVTGSGPFPDGELFDYAWGELKKLNAQIIDEHYYKNPDWFLKNANRYDNYDRKGPKVFAGEYAAQSVAIASPDNKNNWECALSEAAFMTGLERNADVVWLSSYAPLFAHADGWQWTPDLIWFDNLRSFGTPNYYVQKLFSNNKGTQVLQILQENKPLTGQNGIYATAALDKKTNDIIIKIVNSSDKQLSNEINLEGSDKLASKGTWTLLKSDRSDATNSLENPTQILPEEKLLEVRGKRVFLTTEPKSLNILRIKIMQ